MSDVERLEAELALAKALEPLEEAREAMHADRTPETIQAYKTAAREAAAARAAFREQHGPPPASDADGLAMPDTVQVKGTVNNP